MKIKSIIPALLCLLMLAGCTAQQEMNAEMFVDSMSRREGYTFDDLGGTPVRDGKAYAFATCESGARLAFGFDCDENGIVTRAGINANIKNEKEFLRAVADSMEVFAPDDSAEADSIKEKLGLSPGLAESSNKYYDTSWYRYSLIVTDTVLYFAVESKRSVPDAAQEYTLRENETY